MASLGLSCEHPVLLPNGFTVPCGKCNACLNRRSSHNSLLCEIEESQSKYCYFVTLTYDRQSLPTLRYRPSSKFFGYDFYYSNPRDINYGKFAFFYPFKDVKDMNTVDSLIWRKTQLYNGDIGYLCYRDIKLFLKQVRNYTHGKIRYFICGEYGPKHFRPHWHILFYFSDESVENVTYCENEKTCKGFINLVSSLWKFGRVDASSSRRSVSSYVAGYVNSSCRVPLLFKNSVTRPRSFHSVHFGTQSYFKDIDFIYSFGFRFFDNLKLQVLGKFVDIHPWRSLSLGLFPRCVGYAQKTSPEREYSYLILRTARKYYGDCPVSEMSQLIADSDYHSNEVSFYFYYYYHGYIDDYVSSCDEDSYNRYVACIRRELYISRAFERSSMNSYVRGDLRKMFDLIESFYSDKDYSNLKGMYESQSILASRGYLDDCLPFFYDNYSAYYDDFSKCMKSRFYKSFVASNEISFNKKIKHRLLNDANLIFCY